MTPTARIVLQRIPPQGCGLGQLLSPAMDLVSLIQALNELYGLGLIDVDGGRVVHSEAAQSGIMAVTTHDVRQARG